jgi:hypothetical protein
MINTGNYFEAIKTIDFSSLPDALKNGDKLTRGAAQNGWSAYNSNENIKRVVDAYLGHLNEWVRKYIAPEEEIKKLKQKSASKEKSKQSTEKQDSQPMDPTPVEKVTLEIAFIKRYVGLHSKTKDRKQILSFINGLQRAIVEKRIRKTSPYAKEIASIQDQLIKCYEEMGESVLVSIDEKSLKSYTEIAYSEKTMQTVAFIKQFIGIHGHKGVKEKAQGLLNRINKAIKAERIVETDPHFSELNNMIKSLETYLEGKTTAPEINSATLSGLMGIAGFGSKKKSPDENEKPEGIISSVDLASMQFETIGLQGKYRELIGDPSVGFSAMVYGLPKSGKSTLCIDFARHLAEYHGKVLYVAVEEGFGYTLKEKFERLNAIHPNLVIAEKLPEDMPNFQFVFIDSVSKAGLSTDDLTILRKQNPKTAFIYIFHTTKEGNFRGKQDFAHDVDVIINVEKGVAKSTGRFNIGGITDIFSEI